MANPNEPVDLSDIQEDPDLSLLEKSTLIWARLSAHNRAAITRMAAEEMNRPSLSGSLPSESAGGETPSPSTSSEATVRAFQSEGSQVVEDLGAEVQVEATQAFEAPATEAESTPSGSGAQPKPRT